jgi:peptidoglycan/LPS O-acetylase OafA/YrhL
MKRPLLVLQRFSLSIRYTPHRVNSWLAMLLEKHSPKGTIAALDGVRAIACLTVMGYHISLMTRDMHLWQVGWNPFLSAILLAGGAGVTLFFVLSGFLLFLPYVKALLFEQSWPSARQFYMRRALRIIPGYYFSLVLIVLLAQPDYLEPQHWGDLLLFVFFLMDATQSTFRQLNGPYWTLAIEWQFYLLLPLIALGIGCVARRVRPEWRLWAVIGCLLGMAGWGVFTRAWGDYFTANPTATFLIPRGMLNAILFITYGTSGKYLEDFAVGMLVGLLYLVLRSPAVRAAYAHWMRKSSPWLWSSGILLLLYMAMQHYSHDYYYVWPVLPALFQLPNWLAELGFSLGFGCCILAVLFGSARLKWLFEWAPLRWIGVISYSLYIWHLLLLSSFMHNIGPSLNILPAFLAYSLYWVWAALIVVPFSCAGYLLIERPGMRLSERLRNRMLAQQRKEQAIQAQSEGSPELLRRAFWGSG